MVWYTIHGDHVILYRMQHEEGADADRQNHPPGYQDFVTAGSPKNRKRVLPVAPQQRRVMAQSSLVDSFEESYAEKVNILCICLLKDMISKICDRTISG